MGGFHNSFSRCEGSWKEASKSTPQLLDDYVEWKNVFGCLAIIVLVCFISVSVYLHFRFVIAKLYKLQYPNLQKNISAFTW